ncbi:MAG: hypothetical protein K0S07_1025 [Chlamydiales bacterium]|jgi:hypothetical protein|nr:hypothetical protein [Chlamydiales bacterium]
MVKIKNYDVFFSSKADYKKDFSKTKTDEHLVFCLDSTGYLQIRPKKDVENKTGNLSYSSLKNLADALKKARKSIENENCAHLSQDPEKRGKQIQALKRHITYVNDKIDGLSWFKRLFAPKKIDPNNLPGGASPELTPSSCIEEPHPKNVSPLPAAKMRANKGRTNTGQAAIDRTHAKELRRREKGKEKLTDEEPSDIQNNHQQSAQVQATETYDDGAGVFPRQIPRDRPALPKAEVRANKGRANTDQAPQLDQAAIDLARAKELRRREKGKEKLKDEEPFDIQNNHQQSAQVQTTITQTYDDGARVFPRQNPVSRPLLPSRPPSSSPQQSSSAVEQKAERKRAKPQMQAARMRMQKIAANGNRILNEAKQQKR